MAHLDNRYILYINAFLTIQNSRITQENVRCLAYHKTFESTVSPLHRLAITGSYFGAVMVRTPSADSAAATLSGWERPGMENLRSKETVPFFPVTTMAPCSAFTSR